MPGFQIEVLDDSGNVLANNVLGSIVIKLPLPPSCLTTIWGSNNTFVEKYLARFPGYYETGDAGYLDDDGYIYIMARTDDIINVAGHRLSTGQIEEVISGHPDVAECAVIGIADELKGQIPIAPYIPGYFRQVGIIKTMVVCDFGGWLGKWNIGVME